MIVRRTRPLVTASAACAALLVAAAPLLADPSQSESNKRPFTSDFRVGDCTFATQDGGQVGNTFFPLVPGTKATFEDEEGFVHLEISVCDGSNCGGIPGTKTLTNFGNIVARVVQEEESEDGHLVERSRNWFGICEETNAVFYFGEEVELYEDDQLVGDEGSWEAGVDGAEPGIVMPGTFLLGSRYLQELAPGVALDRAEHAAMELSVEVDAFESPLEGCVMVFETSELASSDRTVKVYCPGVGLTIDDDVALTDLMGP